MLTIITHVVLLICNHRAESDKETIQRVKKRVVSDSESENVVVP